MLKLLARVLISGTIISEKGCLVLAGALPVSVELARAGVVRAGEQILVKRQFTEG